MRQTPEIFQRSSCPLSLEKSLVLCIESTNSMIHYKTYNTLGNAYDGKASDMWAMGVLLYTMLYGHFPFYHEDPQELFKKIRSADFGIPEYVTTFCMNVPL